MTIIYDVNQDITSKITNPIQGLIANITVDRDEEESNEYTITITLKHISDEGIESILGITD